MFTKDWEEARIVVSNLWAFLSTPAATDKPTAQPSSLIAGIAILFIYLVLKTFELLIVALLRGVVTRVRAKRSRIQYHRTPTSASPEAHDAALSRVFLSKFLLTRKDNALLNLLDLSQLDSTVLRELARSLAMLAPHTRTYQIIVHILYKHCDNE